ncbi:MAG: hypothetical protein A3J27_15815 [Candidatus Tectomicrobia bacterium RIFCSPLOWO2_12_FULL_69_37]|nr:MAG: hypothetical protein A3I72_05765 [Candidatus Tectomicrobia bacterium RIFCSPLOWO2_02_FULL_70_19]OGL63112.1 MAG: hypothetical protein A3J27_15815 [Candidatus Tectomicrobia bacterium RIFCSPLOWO2_12_FULL_69_37]
MTQPAYYRVEDVASALRCEPEPEEIVAALAERDYRIFEAEQPPGAFVPYHAHEEEETIIVLGGRMQFNVEEELVPVGKGEMIVIRAEAVHSAATVGGRTARLLIAFGAEKRPAKEAGWEGEEDDARP